MSGIGYSEANVQIRGTDGWAVNEIKLEVEIYKPPFTTGSMRLASKALPPRIGRPAVVLVHLADGTGARR